MATIPWLGWARRLRGIGDAGLQWGRDPHDLARYREVQQVAIEMAAAGTSSDLPTVRAVLAEDAGYLTPKVDVRAAIFDGDGRVLLVHERHDGKWSLPGGWADAGETPSEAVIREVREEAGYDVRPVKLAAVLERDRHNGPPRLEAVWKLFFVCVICSGERAAVDHEIHDVCFFALDELPELSLPRVTEAQIELLDAHRRSPRRPTTFD